MLYVLPSKVIVPMCYVRKLLLGFIIYLYKYGMSHWLTDVIRNTLRCRTPPPHIKPQPLTEIVALDPKPVPNPKIVF